MPRIYLDNAATTWPKPATVYEAVDRYQRENGAAAGRGVYREGIAADRLVETARLRVAQLIGAARPESIVFTHNCTDALNLALHGYLKPGSRVITTEAEHNSVLRPLKYLEQHRGIHVVYVPCGPEGIVDLAALEAALRAQRGQHGLVVVSHASNVTGAIQPLETIARLAKQNEVPLLVDAAQSVGAMPMNVSQSFDGVSLLAASGHKGCLGPLGTGFLYLAPDMEKVVEPQRQGGTGTKSDEDMQPTSLPDRYESGNANVPGLAGLAAGVEYLLATKVEVVQAHEQNLIQRLMRGLQSVDNLRLLGPSPGLPRAGLVAFTLDGYDPRELASLLDSHFGIQVRAGLHCAPLIHRRCEAYPTGTVRMSVGPFTIEEEIDAAIAAVREIAAG